MIHTNIREVLYLRNLIRTMSLDELQGHESYVRAVAAEGGHARESILVAWEKRLTFLADTEK